MLTCTRAMPISTAGIASVLPTEPRSCLRIEQNTIVYLPLEYLPLEQALDMLVHLIQRDLGGNRIEPLR